MAGEVRQPQTRAVASGSALRELIRFGLVGLVNTAFGYAIFWLGWRVFGLSPQFANVLGYALSLLLAFVLTRHFVFRAGAAPAGHAAWRFMVAFGVAFAINQLVLGLLLAVAWRPELAQLGAMVSYTIVFFCLNKFFVFQKSGSDQPAS